MMVPNPGEFSGLAVESAADSQQQLTKSESRENDRRSRELWLEKLNPQVSFPGIIMAAGVVGMCSRHYDSGGAYLPQK